MRGLRLTGRPTCYVFIFRIELLFRRAAFPRKRFRWTVLERIANIAMEKLG